MTDFRDIRAPLLRSKSATHSPVPGFGFSSGDIPPELSPLDELAKQGRLLKRQLEGRNGVTLTPQSVQKSLHRPIPGSRSPLERSFSVDSQAPQASDRRLDGFGIHFSTQSEADRLVSSYPRFSTVSSDVSSSRDSTLSNGTVRPESSISNVFPAHLANAPNLYNNSDHHSPVKEFEFNARDSVKASIENVLFDEPAYSPTQRYPGVDFDQIQSSGDHSRRVETPPMAPVRHDSGHEVSESEPIPDRTIGSNRQGTLIGSSTVNQVAQSHSEQNNNKPQYQAFSYARYAAAKQNSIGGDRFGPPSRQNSNEADTFAHPSRHNSNERFQTPSRTNSNEQDRFGPPNRQNSNERDRFGPPVRQNTNMADLERGRQRPSPPPLKNLNTFVPSIAKIRVSPDSAVSRDSHGAFGPPPAPMTKQPSPDTQEPLYQYSRSAGPSTPRSPSVGSDVSAYSPASRAPPKGINFSRPILTSKPPIGDSLDRQSHAHTPSNIPTNSGRFTPMGFEGIVGEEDVALVTSDYTYSKYELPRGRNLPRNSLIFQDAPDFSQEPPREPEQRAQATSTHAKSAPPTPAVPPTPSNYSTNARELDPVSSILRQTNPNPLAKSPTLAIPGNRMPSPHLGSEFRSTLLQAPRTPRSQPFKQPSKDGLATAASLSAEEHVNLGIECHEKGSLQESSYHLRCAANAGNPTGMLLYALALRHGWGMKPNPKEGVTWLKKVTQLAGSEVAEAEMNNSTMDLIARKGRKAQFALSIYELGVSHLNGWGTEQDKGLALRCFEIAGKWGDPDALAEAGYCYANGVGCKKDMKKSAKYYRLAEAKGVNMVGNSWIWKDKYLDDSEKKAKAKKEGKPDPTEKEKHHGGGFFLRKKNTPGHH